MDNPLDIRENDAAEAIRAFHDRDVIPAKPSIAVSEDELDAETVKALAGTGLLLMPSVIQTETHKEVSLYRDHTLHLKKLLRAEGISATLLPTEGDVLVEQSIDAHLPEIVIASHQILTNPEFVKLILKVVTDYIRDAIKKSATFSGKATLKVKVVHEDGASVSVRYEGPESGLADVTDAIKAAAKRQR